MNYKLLCTFLFLLNIANAAIQEVQVGSIDSYYANSITKKELHIIINEIEQQFETQLGFDVFNYSYDGIPIHIVYIPPSKLEKNIQKKLKSLKKKKEKINKLKNSFPSEKIQIENFQKGLKKFAAHINNMTISLNDYIQNSNKRRDYSSHEYKKMLLFVKNKQMRIKRDIVNLRKERRILRRMSNDYNKKIYTFNSLVNSYNKLSNQIMKMSHNKEKIKGTTFGLKEINHIKIFKNNTKTYTKTIKNTMTKIEIYSFKSKKELKAILAHEIAHLVGIPHIKVKNALMHPIVQQNQIENLFLTNKDIEAFKKYF